MMDPERKSKPGTRLMEPPKQKPKENEQVPAGDDSDINEGKDFRQPEDVRDDRPATKNKPIEKDSGTGEDSGCAC